jgi:intein/homing endonuclease
LARGSWGEGWRRIDEITTDDEVLSRDEHDPSGPLVWKKVEETFERVGLVLELEVGGRTIGTTAEHPFYVFGKGWTAAGELKPGDRIVGLDLRESVAVTALRLTGRQEKPHNLAVADNLTDLFADM